MTPVSISNNFEFAQTVIWDIRIEPEDFWGECERLPVFMLASFRLNSNKINLLRDMWDTPHHAIFNIS